MNKTNPRGKKNQQNVKENSEQEKMLRKKNAIRKRADDVQLIGCSANVQPMLYILYFAYKLAIIGLGISMHVGAIKIDTIENRNAQIDYECDEVKIQRISKSI